MILSSHYKTKNFKILGKPKKAKLRLFCFSFAGGSASTYSQWHHYLPEYIEVVAVQLPGREERMREEAYTTLLPLIESLYEEFITLNELPYALFGHSLGAFLCVAFAKYLEEKNQETPQHLFLSASYAPEDLKNRKKISDLPNFELINEIKNLNGTPTEILDEPNLIKHYLPIIRSDFKLLENLKSENYINYRFNCPITILGGKQDQFVKSDLLKHWKKCSLISCVIKLFDGDHFFILSDMHNVLSEISKELRFLITNYYVTS